MTPRGWWVLGVAGLAACATPGHVKQVQDQVALLRAELARGDSARLVQLAEVQVAQRRTADSLEAARAQLRSLRTELGAELYDVQQQMVQVQALTGQSQQRLSELRAQLEARAGQLAAAVAAPRDTAATAAAPAAPAPGTPAVVPAASADQMYEASLQQMRRGSMGTARAGFLELLRAWPQSDRAPDALYYVGQSFAAEAPDSAVAYYERVAKEFPRSSRAASAIYNVGLLADRRKDATGAKAAFERVVRLYPRSDEAALARDRLKPPAR
ncbi:MAG: tetratricopeptide repeat protein [Gemmatimonadales bacterium]|nr:tetratricopeptide repeat protein [Gemmatimonadales bacterium]